MMKLIRENIETVEFFSENTDTGRVHFFGGVFLQSEIVNKNRRKYHKATMELAVENYRNAFIVRKNSYGELDHPDTPEVKMQNVSHLITELTETGNDFEGKAKILTFHPNGRLVQGFLEEGCTLGVSSRGLAKITKDAKGVSHIKEDFVLTTAADVVSNPSAHSAFIDGLMEGVEWICESGIWTQQKFEDVREDVHATSGPQLAEKRLAVFAEFLRDLRHK